MLSQYATFGRQPRKEACMGHHEKSERIVYRYKAAMLNCSAILSFIMIVFAWGTQKMNETRVKSFSEKTFACRDGGEKSTETR